MKRKIDAFVFDLDGTVYLGESALPTAVETIAELVGFPVEIVSVGPDREQTMFAGR